MRSSLRRLGLRAGIALLLAIAAIAPLALLPGVAAGRASCLPVAAPYDRPVDNMPAPQPAGLPGSLAASGTFTVPLCLSVAYQGHGASGTNRWMLPVETVIYDSASQFELDRWTQTTDAGGGYCVQPNVPGWSTAIDIRAKHSHTLSNERRAVPVPWPAEYISLGVLLEGDANNNDQVSIIDFSILRTTYGLACPPCDSRADFNVDGYISILDFSLLRTNYGRSGPIVVAGGQAGAGVQATGVTLSLAAAAPIVPAWGLDVNVVMETGPQPVDGVDIYLSYDPAVLRVVDEQGGLAGAIQPGAALPSVLQNTVDHQAGEISFSAGILDGSAVSGTVTLARFRLAPAGLAYGPTTIYFDGQPPRRSDVAYSGESVLGAAFDAGFDAPRTRLALPVIVR